MRSKTAVVLLLCFYSRFASATRDGASYRYSINEPSDNDPQLRLRRGAPSGTTAPPSATLHPPVSASPGSSPSHTATPTPAAPRPNSPSTPSTPTQTPVSSAASPSSTPKVVQDNHDYYRLVRNSHADERWVELDESDDAVRHTLLSDAHRLAVFQSFPSTFRFKYYGHTLSYVVIATGGFLYMGTFFHRFLTATQFIAPLMANFATSLHSSSDIVFTANDKYAAFEWRNVLLNDDREAGPFRFQCVLYAGGRIDFNYREIPKPVNNISAADHSVNVGIADAYYVDFTNGLRQIVEYHKVMVNRSWVKENSSFSFLPLPTCMDFTNCSACVQSQTAFDCAWCPALNRCGSGVDRGRQRWLTAGCDRVQKFTPTTCAALYTTKATTTSQKTLKPTMPSTSDHSTSTPRSAPPTKATPSSTKLTTHATSTPSPSTKPSPPSAKPTSPASKTSPPSTQTARSSTKSTPLSTDRTPPSTKTVLHSTKPTPPSTKLSPATTKPSPPTAKSTIPSTKPTSTTSTQNIRSSSTVSGSTLSSGAGVAEESSQSKSNKLSAGGIFGIIFFLLLVGIVVGVVVQGYRRPYSRTGQFLIRNRPSELWRRFKQWRRGGDPALRYQPGTAETSA